MYGEYYLPNDIFVATKGIDVMDLGRREGGITTKNTFWKKKGYVVVEFDIETGGGSTVKEDKIYYYPNKRLTDDLK